MVDDGSNNFRWSEREEGEDLPRDLEVKLGWIPGQLLRAYSINDGDSRLKILEVRYRGRWIASDKAKSRIYPHASAFLYPGL